ncbi:4-hydroxy-3-methylbut-2-enyl diphosphate reductase [Clostridium tarantellae]|uniref:4-hydroxy-3-methylbut-2-enyl diphosphate reductase n=1 Tax=Clostridium tarantellae TaxID=39493 RepID=A0A6I1MNA8_9CLOT|nr:4-hydroxy-3-methylbut-2-enyl diphosphate reductase [Clostridium tarantellae]MPQ44450.1 4-hydroxy-3-methylbut-2-enyl diphosphate reductase [Clostridium tarantellae]
MNIKVVLAENAGFCFGVKRAVDEAIKTQKQYKKNIYTLGPLIHNNDAVKYLEHNNVYAIDIKDIDNLCEGDVILIRSHGVKANVIEILKNKGLIVVNATCPYVTNIQQKAKTYYEKGYKIIIIGDEKHPEVVGINGWCNDEAIIVNGKNIPKEFPKRVCVLCQTTEKKETWNKVLTAIANCSKEIVAFNTICSATDVRQKSAKELSESADKIIVIGGKNSSNTTKLYEICKKNCNEAYHIENSKELTNELLKNKDITIGITAGASTPEWVIKEVIEKIKNK